MRLGISLGLAQGQSSTPSLGPSLYDTGDFNSVGGTAGYQDIIDADSFRICRNASGAGRLTWTLLSTGTYRFRGTLSAYDGAQTGITTPAIRLNDNFSLVGSVVSVGPFNFTATFTTTTARFLYGTPGEGCRIDDFHVEAV